MSKNLLGLKVGRWEVIKETPISHKWECRCECGKTGVVSTYNLENGVSKSCGCYNRDRAIETNTSHGMRRTRIYKIWQGIKERCSNPRLKIYKDYGGRGITVCDKWLMFEGFYEDMHEGYHETLTLDRIDNSGGYNKSNCRWTTMQEQSNNRRNNALITVDGVTDTIANMSRKYNIDASTLKRRIYRGWEHDRAVKEPIHYRGQK